MGETKEVNHILDDVEVVEAFINGDYKSIYLMDAWMNIRNYICEKEKEVDHGRCVSD